MSENNTTASILNTMDSNTIGAWYLVTSLLVIFSNAIVVVVVVTSRELHLPTLWNTAFMALCDFCYGLYYLLFVVPSAFMNKFAYPAGFIAPTSFLATSLFGQNILNIVLATFDRYLSVCWPLRYHQIMSSKRFLTAVLITVAINIVHLCLTYLPKADVTYHPRLAICSAKFNTVVGALASVGLPVVSVLVVIGLLMKIFLELVRSRRRLPTSQLHNRRFTITVSLSVGLFCLSYLPTSITIIWNVKNGKAHVPLDLVRFGIISLMSNSVWNVLIYATTYKPFRDAFLRLFCKAYYRRKRQMEVTTIAMNEREISARQTTHAAVNVEN